MANWRPIQAITKALSQMRHAGAAPFMLGFLKRSGFDYRKEVGTGLDASVVTAPVQFIQRAFPEAPLRVVRRKGDEEEEIDGHPLPALVDEPNEFYGGEDLWAGTIFSYLFDGNAYWLKARNGAGRTAELWYTPHWLMEPKWPAGGATFIEHYEYRPGDGAVPMKLDPADVVHFRYGVDPRNPRKGISPLHGVLREIFMDLEASNFTASLLRNMGVPGLVLSPEAGVQPTPEDIEATKAWLRQAFTGDRRGQPLVMGSATKAEMFGFNPQQLDLSVARDLAEERVCACLGIPAAVVGFGAGLQTAKVGATMGELVKLGWTNGICPLQRRMAKTVTRSLLPDLGGGAGQKAEFDASEILALEEDLVKRAQRYDTMVRGGWALVSEGREAMGLDVDDADRIYLRPFSAIEVPAGQSIESRPKPPASEPAPEPEEEGPDDDGKGLDARGRFGSGHKQAKQTRRRATRQQLAYLRAIETMEGPLATAWEKRLTRFFASIGKAAAAAARPVLERHLPDLGEAQAQGGETKQDDLAVGEILEQLELPLHQTTFQQLYERQYLAVAEEVSKAGELLGLATSLPDPVARAVVAAGGRRSGLVDLTSQSRRGLFDALAEGRAEGEGVEQLAARIAEHVEGGPWTTAEQRARTIARTETKYAQNVSTLARAQHEGVERFMVFDGRLGPGRSDPEHIARDGSIVDAAEADRLAQEEHPNGTLSLSPYFDLDDDDEED